MRSRALLPVLFVLLTAVARAAGPEATGSVTVNGKTVTLSHGRAWRTGVASGVPTVSIVLAEKPLDGLDWAKGDSSFSEGQRGVALRIDPSADPSNTRDKEPYRYAIAEDYEIQLHSGAYRGWHAASLTAANSVEEITVSNGWAQGKVEWKGSLPNPFAEEEVLTAYSASFKLPLETLPE